MHLRICYLLLINSLNTVCWSQTSIEKVLFVGNSYTYFWNLPLQVQLMAEAKGLHLDVYQSTAGGVNLGDHWRGAKNLNTSEIISNGNFDVVILQDHSLRALEHPDSLVYFADLISDHSRLHGSQIMLYETWARQSKPMMQAAISQGYQLAADIASATVVPVGTAWALSLKSNPSFGLHSADQTHPSTQGSYLTACMFFGTLTGLSPVGLPARLSRKGDKGEQIYFMILTEEEAHYCQTLADKVLREVGLIKP